MALGYSQPTDADIVNLPVPQLQTDGFLFVWVINAKYKFTLDLFEKWGYSCAPLRLCVLPVAALIGYSGQGGGVPHGMPCALVARLYGFSGSEYHISYIKSFRA